jgi:CubicO group peptidase (beta-lactamase class C family)
VLRVWEDGHVSKTTVDLPDPLLRQAKVVAARRGVPLKQLFAEALREQLRMRHTANGAPDGPRDLRDKNGGSTTRAKRNRVDDDREYTPAQRRMISARIEKAEKGPWYGPFKSASEVAVFLKDFTSARKSAKARKSA